jgi:hypothetical protein
MKSCAPPLRKNAAATAMYWATSRDARQRGADLRQDAGLADRYPHRWLCRVPGDGEVPGFPMTDEVLIKSGAWRYAHYNDPRDSCQYH